MRLDSSARHRPLPARGPNSQGGEGNPHQGSHFLGAGQVYVSPEPRTIVLILGSCAGVCIWDPLSGIGGATHYLLPSWDGRGIASARYGNIAVEALLQNLTEAGAKRAQLVAKIFGGACLFQSMRGSEGRKESLGERNVEMALQILDRERIPVVCTEVGGQKGQRVVFHTATGESLVTRL